MRVKGTKANRRFTYDADKGLEVELQNAREELKKKTAPEKRGYIRFAYEKAKKEYEAYEQRITDLEAFIYTAEKEIEKQRSKGCTETKAYEADDLPGSGTDK